MSTYFASLSNFRYLPKNRRRTVHCRYSWQEYWIRHATYWSSKEEPSVGRDHGSPRYTPPVAASPTTQHRRDASCRSVKILSNRHDFFTKYIDNKWSRQINTKSVRQHWVVQQLPVVFIVVRSPYKLSRNELETQSSTIPRKQKPVPSYDSYFAPTKPILQHKNYISRIPTAEEWSSLKTKFAFQSLTTYLQHYNVMECKRTVLTRDKIIIFCETIQVII